MENKLQQQKMAQVIKPSNFENLKLKKDYATMFCEMFLEHLKSIFLEYYVCRKSLSNFSDTFLKKTTKSDNFVNSG